MAFLCACGVLMVVEPFDDGCGEEEALPVVRLLFDFGLNMAFLDGSRMTLRGT